jgi:predicted KAP-like P-loop ATPase
MSSAYIYGLYDPRDNALRYIGCTKNLHSRIINHRTKANECLSDYRKGNLDYFCKFYSDKDRWLAGLFEKDLFARVDVLAIVEHKTSTRAHKIEASLIRSLSFKSDLVNEHHNVAKREVDLKYDYHLSEELKHQRRYYH